MLVAEEPHVVLFLARFFALAAHVKHMVPLMRPHRPLLRKVSCRACAALALFVARSKIATLAILTYYCFPDGRLVSGRGL